MMIPYDLVHAIDVASVEDALDILQKVGTEQALLSKL